MKRNLLGLALLLVMGLMIFNKDASAQEVQAQQTKVDVYYFHGTKRCETCEAIEKETIKTLNGSFAEQMESGIIKFHILNRDEKANRALVEKYEIGGSSLILVPASGGDVVDLTNKAFMYAKDQAFAFRKELKEQLNKLL
jgi:hypothetical protein